MDGKMAGVRAHLDQALHWSPGGGGNASAVVFAAAGMAVPVLVGSLNGHPGGGFAAALGTLAAGGGNGGSSLPDKAGQALLTVTTVVLAALLRGAVNGCGWGGEGLVVLSATAAALAGGYSRPAAAAATRFVVLLTMMGAVEGPPETLAPGFVLFIAMGAAWGAALGLLVSGPKGLPPPGSGSKRATARQKLRRWMRLLGMWAAWSYPLRLAACLGMAAVLNRQWPDHHLHWIALTVSLVLERTPTPFSVRVTQRILGTALGVLASPLLLGVGGPWGVGSLAGFLAGLRQWLKGRNYLAYSLVMTPLAVLILDAGHPPDGGVLIDRLAATALGGALVVAVNGLAARVAPPPEDGLRASSSKDDA